MQKKNNRSNLLIVSTLCFVLVAGAVLAWLLIFADREPVSETELIIRDDETVRIEQEEERLASGGGDSKNQPGGSDRPEQGESSDGEKSKANAKVTNMTEKDGVLTARGMVSNTTNTDAICVFRFYFPNGDYVDVNSEPLGNPTSVTCSAVSVPINGRKGTWRVTLWYSSETMEGMSTEEPYEVK